MGRDRCVEIRHAQPEDAPAIAGVHVRSWRATYAGTLSAQSLESIDVERRTALWSRRLTRPSPGMATLVAVVDGALAGFALLSPTPDVDDDPTETGQVLSLHVDPAATDRGLGRALLRRAVEDFGRAGLGAASLWVVQSNRRARRFYERAGWARDGGIRRELLAVEGEEGEEVTVVRYRLRLPKTAEG